MDTHKKTQNDSFNPKAVFASEAMRATWNLMPTVSPEAYCLSTYLSSWWNNSNSNNAIYPDENQVCTSLSFTSEQFRAALIELEGIGWWKAIWNADGSIKEYKPSFPFSPHELKWRVKKHKGFSLNHGKVISRYIRTHSQTTHAIMLWVVANTRQVYNDLGKKHFVDNGNTMTKLCHGAYFNHRAMKANGDREFAYLASFKQPKEEWTIEQPVITRVSLEALRRSFHISTDAFRLALREIEELGLWTVDYQPDVFSGTQYANEAHEVAVLTPTYRLHCLVWDFENYSGGTATGLWERKHGLAYSQRGQLPALGYHYIYALVSRKTGSIYIVGQTTQALTTRLHQHQQLATNADANAAVRSIQSDPEDTLDIRHLATVFHSDVAEVEMDWAHEFINRGHPIKNKILTVKENRRTIKSDVRFGVLGERSEWEELSSALHKILTTKLGRRILWDCRDRDAA